MMPRALQERGLLPAISDMLEKSLGLTAIRYKLEHYKVQDVRFDERVEVGVYRVCQELVSNIIKHSGATEVMVQLLFSKKYLILIVEDNGRGFSSENSSSGIGLMNMTSRINTVNGDITMEPSPESGTVATIRIPIA
jgi:signal transduction histidine kinase